MLTGTRELIRDVNVVLVLDAIRHSGPVSRAEIARRTRLGKSTVTGIVDRLLKEGLVLEVGTGTSEGGRRPILLDLNPSARFVVAVKLAPSQVTVALCDLKGRLMPDYALSLPTASPSEVPDRATRGDTVLRTLVRAINEAVDASGVPWKKVMGIGVALPGVVDVATGTSVSSHFLTWAHLPLKELLEQRFGCAVVVDNDANAMTLAEYRMGAGVGSRCLIGVTVGIGIGAGIVVDGRLFRGAMGGAGEIGHVPMIPDGPACRCGRQGCLEALAGDEGIVRIANRLGLDASSREEVVVQAMGGDGRALAALREAADLIGRALATAVNLFNPDVIVVGGEAVAQAGELLLAPIREGVRAYAFNGLAEGVEIRQARVLQNPWLLGVGLEVLEALFTLPWGSVPQSHR